MTSIYEPWDAARGAEIIAQHTHLEGATLVILHALQATFGYVPEPAIPMIASALNLSRPGCHRGFKPQRLSPVLRTDRSLGSIAAATHTFE